MSNSFNNSFKIVIDEDKKPSEMEQENVIGLFSKEIDIVKEDIHEVEKLYTRLRDSNQQIKDAAGANTVRDLRLRLNADLDELLKLAKQINKKFDGLVMVAATQRRLHGSGPGSADDQTRASMISDLAENLKQIMRSFQGLRVQMETDQRQLIEIRYFAITRERATAEAIENLIASQAPETPLHYAMKEHGRDAVEEIQERRDTMIEVRRSLMDLNQVLLGISMPLEVQSGGGGGPVSPMSPAAGFPAQNGGKTGGLNDYERETRNQAYFAIGLAMIIIICIIVTLLKVENSLEKVEP